MFKKLISLLSPPKVKYDPCITYIDNAEHWWKHGKRHREDGPAVISKGNSKHAQAWYIDGNNITEEVKKWIKEYDYPEWKDDTSWDDSIKLHFKLTFG